MIYTPRPYQFVAQDLAEDAPNVLLAVEPGGGKTVATGSAIANIDEMTLIVAPKMVAQEVWSREFAKWDHLSHLAIFNITAATFGYYRRVTTAAVLNGEAREIRQDLMTAEDRFFLFAAEVTVDTNEVVPRDHRAAKKAILDRPERIHVVSRDHFFNLVKLLGDDWPYKVMVGDESTTWKNWDSQRYHALEFLMAEGLVEQLKLLSGTPSPRGIENLFAQVKLLDGGKRLGAEIGKFRKTYMEPDQRQFRGPRIYSWKPLPGAVDAVTAKIRDICLSVRADIWRQNEPPRTVQHVVQMPDDAVEIYRTMANDAVVELGGVSISAAQAAAVGQKLAQISSGIIYDETKKAHVIHDAKLDALEELVESLEGEPILLLYWYPPNLARLKARFPGLATTKTKGFLDRFGAGELPLLALQPGSAGHGLDGLQHGSHHVAVFDIHPDWELYKQAIDRIDRSGQKYQVTVHQFIAAGGQDRRVANVLADRGACQNQVMDAIRRT